MTCLGQAPVSEHEGRSQAQRPHPDLDGYPQTRKWIQTTRDSGLGMLQRDGHLRVMSWSEQCQNGPRNQNPNLQALWPDRDATVTFGEQTCRLHKQAPGNLNQLLHLWRHLSSSQGFLTRGWKMAALQEVEHRGNLPTSFFLLVWRDVNRNQHRLPFQRTGFKSQHPPTRQLTAVCNSNPRGSKALFGLPWARDTPVLHVHKCRQNA